jgi:outer membrane protein assembly factor BamB
VLFLAACGGRRPPLAEPTLPPPAAWKTLLGEFVEPPLATDGRRLLVATRDGVIRSLDPSTGEVLWKAEQQPGRLSAADGTVLVRRADGTLVSLHPRTGAVRWQVATGVAGDLPAVIDEDRAIVAGQGLSAVELAAGRVLWTDATARATAPPVRAGYRLLTGEADGSLRSRDRETGAPAWEVRTQAALAAPPLVDTLRQRAYLGTTDKRLIEVSLRDGDTGWRWTVGADVVHPGLLLRQTALFASHDAVLYAMRLGGNLAWRSGLPSRPLSGPFLAGSFVLVACLENEVVVFDPSSGKRLGSFRTAAEIRTAPLMAGSVIAIGLRDRSVVGYALPGTPVPPPAPATEPPPGAALGGSAAPASAPAPPPPPAVEPPRPAPLD